MAPPHSDAPGRASEGTGRRGSHSPTQVYRVPRAASTPSPDHRSRPPRAGVGAGLGCSTGEFSKLKKIAQEFETELWLTAHTHRDAPQDQRGVPPFVSQFEDYISVLISLEPVETKVRIKFVKTHDTTPPQGIHLEFDPITQLIHWT